MKHADSLGASYALILGEEEVRKGIILARNMKDGSQKELPLDVAGLPGAVARLASVKV
jgi:histidyl-tRNA synthetase